MLAGFGYLTLALAFLLAVYGLVMVIWGLAEKSGAAIESARLALILLFSLVTLSVIALVVLLLGNRFDVAYVYSVTSRDMPAYLKLTALWGGQSGSLLFWSWLLAGFSMVFALRKWGQEKDLLPWSLLVVFVVLGFFLALNVLFEPPFERFWLLQDGQRIIAIFQPAGALSLEPNDGQGLNPLLRHPGMIWHPPALYLGFVGFIIPFALGAATLAVGRRDQRWLEIARPWTLIAWVFLSLGLVLGMRWAYDVLGWGGYWGWDPVEIAALMPWLSATAFVHTALLQRRKQDFKRWNYVLIILTFSLVIFGTFLTRSGVLSSVHSFAGSDIGLPMFIFTALITVGTLVLLFYRWRNLGGTGELEFALSREVLTLFSNLIFLSILLVCLLGVVYPIFSDLLTGIQVTVGPEWYERITGPLFLLLLLLMGICPLTAWSGKTLVRSGKSLRILIPLSLLVPAFAWLFGDVRSLYALFALWLASLACLVILGEYVRGVVLELQRKDGGFLKAVYLPLQRNRQRYGGLLVHLGIVLMSLGIIGLEGLQQEKQVTLDQWESVTLGKYQFQFEGLEDFTSQDGQQITRAVLTLSRDGKPVGSLYPERQVYLSMGMAVTQPAVKSDLAKDLYAILVEWEPDTQTTATFRIFINPLVNWLWIGVGVLTLGTVLALWPRLKEQRTKTPGKSSQGWRILGLIVSIILLGMIGIRLFINGSKPAAIGDRPQEFSLQTFSGQRIDTADLRGKTILVHFWSSWCASCDEESKILEQAWQTVQSDKSREIIFLGIAFNDTEPAAQAFLSGHGVTYPNGPDLKGEISKIYQVKAVPETYILDAEGRLRAVKLGPFSSIDEIFEMIMLAERGE